MVFCNDLKKIVSIKLNSHNPYFNRWFSAIRKIKYNNTFGIIVTILILIDGFLQLKLTQDLQTLKKSHNPYFNRWFSAM